MGSHLFLSPHLDDAVLSCGAYISKLLKEGESVKVITLFTGCPPEDEISTAAKRFHEECGVGPEPIKFRCEEDVAAMRYLGCEFRHAGFYECLYRKNDSGEFIYPDLENIYHLEIEMEQSFMDVVEKDIFEATKGFDQIYAPLGIGNHADHLLIRRIVEKISSKLGKKTLFYQDFPYEVNSSDRPKIEVNGHSPNTVVELSQEDVETKIHAIKLYESQIHILFDDENDMERCVYRHSRECDGRYAYSICFYA